MKWKGTYIIINNYNYVISRTLFQIHLVSRAISISCHTETTKLCTCQENSEDYREFFNFWLWVYAYKNLDFT